MAGLQRFITYIYKYENDEKKENAGFAKIEIRGSICRMEVHIRNISMDQPETTIYLFARNEKIMQGVPVGSITAIRGNGDVRYAFETKELANFGMEMGDMEGIYIPIGEAEYFASQWKEGTIAKEYFRILEKIRKQDAEEKNAQDQDMQRQNAQNRDMQKQSAQEQQQTPGQNTIKQNAGGQKSKEQIIQKDEPKNQDSAENEPLPKQTVQTEQPKRPQQPIQATELPEEEFFEETGWARIFQKLRLKLDICFPFEGEEIECVRMQLNDLQEFPQKYWYIGNNSFLLHGFFNYKHLIFGEMTEGGRQKYFIGVPGVFLNQERVMAAMFGFPEFRTAKTTEYKTGNFGYWYRFI